MHALGPIAKTTRGLCNKFEKQLLQRRIAISIDTFLSKYFPERRIFLRSDDDIRFIRLRPLTQSLIFAALATFISWSIIATSLLLMDSIGLGNFRQQSKRDHQIYQQRLKEMDFQRNARRQEAMTAHMRFALVLKEVSQMQSQLFDSELEREELKTTYRILQDRLSHSLEKNKKLTRNAKTRQIALALINKKYQPKPMIRLIFKQSLF